MSSFVERVLSATFTLASNGGSSGFFTGTTTDTLTLSGLRMSARINKAQAMSGSKLSLAIFGMTISQMNDLCTLGTQIQLLSRNTIVLQAGDAESGMSTVFEGIILDAYADFNDMPNVVFIVTANSTGSAAVQPMQSTSLPGPVNIASTFRTLATAAGYNFENNVGSLAYSGAIHLNGSPKDQMNDLAELAHIDWGIDDNTVAIWPKNGSRATSNIPIVSPQTGLIKYPSYTANGIIFQTVFNPAIIFQGLVKVESAIFNANFPFDNSPNTAFERGLGSGFFPANGVWAVSELDHYLDCKVPHGDWKSVVACYNPAYAPPAVAPSVLPSQ